MAIDPTLSFKVLRPDQVDHIDAVQQTEAAGVANLPLQRQKLQQDVAQGDIQTRLQQLKEAHAKIDAVGQLIGGAVDQQSYDLARQKAQQMGLDVSDEPPQFDPNYVKSLGMQTLDMKDKLELEMQKTLNDAKVATEGAQAGSYSALSNQRNTAAGLNRANTQKVLNPTQPAPPNPAGTPGVSSPMPAGKAPAGYRFKPDGTLEPIPGGPGEKVSAELSARLGLTEDALKQLPAFIEKAKSGALSGPIDYAMGQMGRGEQGKQYREISAASEALTRMLTGAGMNIQEVENEVKMYKPRYTDDAPTIANKAEQLQRRLIQVRETAMKGRGGVPSTGAPLAAPSTTIPHDDIDAELAKRGVK